LGKTVANSRPETIAAPRDWRPGKENLAAACEFELGLSTLANNIIILLAKKTPYRRSDATWEADISRSAPTANQPRSLPDLDQGLSQRSV
jgi:hypothetical protein